MKPAISESTHARQFMQWCMMHRARFEDLSRIYHVPNGGGRSSKAQSAMLKAEGVRPFVPDYHLDLPLHGFHGLKIELKKFDGAVYDGQIDEIVYLRRKGYAACFAFGWEAAATAVTLYYTMTEMPSVVIAPALLLRYQNLARKAGGEVHVHERMP
jgi:hypothetical protein